MRRSVWNATTQWNRGTARAAFTLIDRGRKHRQAQPSNGVAPARRCKLGTGWTTSRERPSRVELLPRDFVYVALTEPPVEPRGLRVVRRNLRLNHRVGILGSSHCAAFSLRCPAGKNRTPAPARRRAPGPRPAAVAPPPPVRAGRFAPGIRDSHSGSRHCRDAG